LSWEDPNEFSNTITLNAEVEIVPGTNGGKTTLLIEKRYYNVLNDATDKTDSDTQWYRPITAINYGNSSLSDGFITFYLANRASSDAVPTYITKFTAMNQAKDKLGDSGEPKGPLPMKKIAANAERCTNRVLDGVFGPERLLLVSTPTDGSGLFAKKAVMLDRKWIPRVMAQCQILKDVMKTLANQRCKATRMETHAVQVNARGKTVPFEKSDDMNGLV
jgi:hypothetical protein